MLTPAFYCHSLLHVIYNTHIHTYITNTHVWSIPAYNLFCSITHVGNALHSHLLLLVAKTKCFNVAESWKVSTGTYANIVCGRHSTEYFCQVISVKSYIIFSVSCVFRVYCGSTGKYPSCKLVSESWFYLKVSTYSIHE